MLFKTFKILVKYCLYYPAAVTECFVGKERNRKEKNQTYRFCFLWKLIKNTKNMLYAIDYQHPQVYSPTRSSFRSLQTCTNPYLLFIFLHYPVKGPSAVGFLEKLKCSWHTDGFRISIILEEPLFNWRFFLTYPHHLKYHKKKKNVTKYTYSFCFKCERIPCSTIKLDKIFFLKEKKIAQVFVFIWYDGIWTCQLSAGF